MTIGIDLRCLPMDGSPGAGVAHAVRELTRILVRLNPDISWKVYVPQGAVWDAHAERLAQCSLIRLASDSGAELRKALRSSPCDLLFVPSGCVPPGIQIPCIPWVHDVAIFRSAAWFPQSILRRMATTRLFLRGVRRAKRVLAVSEWTARELSDVAGIDAQHIAVTSEGGDPYLADLAHTDLAEAKRLAKLRVADTGVTQPYLLWMGTVEPRKNVETVVAAWMEARSSFSRPVDLVIAGKDGWKLGPIHRVLKSVDFASEGESRLHRIVSVTDDERRDLLLGAEVVVLPSWHEGFGLVALEAMQAGTAVMVSSEGGMAEIVGEAGIVLSPADIRAWAQAMVGLMADDASRQELAQAGMSRSQGFSWERTARIVYERLTDLG